MSTDEFHKVGFNEHPSATDLCSRQTPCLGALAHLLLVHAQERGRLNETECWSFPGVHGPMMTALLLVDLISRTHGADPTGR